MKEKNFVAVNFRLKDFKQEFLLSSNRYTHKLCSLKNIYFWTIRLLLIYIHYFETLIR